jgi:hypothetical protein
MFNKVFEAFGADSTKWDSMTNWQKSAFVINYLAAIYIIFATVYPEKINKFMYMNLHEKFGVGTNSVFYLVIFSALIIIAMNTSNAVTYTELI